MGGSPTVMQSNIEVHRRCFRGFLPFHGHAADIVGNTLEKIEGDPWRPPSNAFSHHEVNGLESEAGRTTV